MVPAAVEGGAGPDRGSGAGGSAAPPGATAARTRTRLYVEQDGKGVFVYRLVDTATGRLLAEVPREQADTLKNSPAYSAGAIVSAQA